MGVLVDEFLRGARTTRLVEYDRVQDVAVEVNGPNSTPDKSTPSASTWSSAVGGYSRRMNRPRDRAPATFVRFAR